MTQDYGYPYHTYPVWSEEQSIEGQFKRFRSFPTPQEVYEYILRGLPVFSTLLSPTLDPRALITIDVARDALESAIGEIEMDLGCNLSPVVHFESKDAWPDMWGSNYSGLKLERWPATKIINAQVKFPHAVTNAYYQVYTVPPYWTLLKRNNFNIVAGQGNVMPASYAQNFISPTAWFAYTTGFGRGYSPSQIEITYQAGFDSDKLPSNVADLIKTWAGARMLADILPIIAPYASVTNTLDSVTQSATSVVAQFLVQRLQAMQLKKKELAASLKKGFGKTVNYTFLGSGGG